MLDINLRHIEDHLHLRGEYPALPPIQLPILGSSPLTWRILGETCPLTIASWDHLHLRGEYTKRSLI